MKQLIPYYNVTYDYIVNNNYRYHSDSMLEFCAFLAEISKLPIDYWQVGTLVYRGLTPKAHFSVSDSVVKFKRMYNELEYEPLSLEKIYELYPAMYFQMYKVQKLNCIIKQITYIHDFILNKTNDHVLAHYIECIWLKLNGFYPYVYMNNDQGLYTQNYLASNDFYALQKDNFERFVKFNIPFSDLV